MTYLQDPYCQKYSYLSLVGTIQQVLGGTAPFKRGLAPITVSLSSYMGFKDEILLASNATAVNNMYDSQGYMRNFICPGQAGGNG